jgi:hypothetical protein
MKVPLTKTSPVTGTTVFNQELDWWPSDSEESFYRMMKDPVHRQYFAEQGWDRPGTITYRFNNIGFRGDDIELETPCLCAFGCSFTMGIGLPQNSVWPWLVGNALGLKVYNFSLGGASADWCFRMAEYWVPKLKPKLAIFCAPPPERTEAIVDDAGNARGYSAHEPIDDIFLKTWFTFDENQRLNNVKNRLAFRGLCSQVEVPGLVYDAHEWFGKSREEVGYARDYMHAGIKGHQYLANRIINDWNEIKHR